MRPWGYRRQVRTNAARDLAPVFIMYAQLILGLVLNCSLNDIAFKTISNLIFPQLSTCQNIS